MKVVIQRVSEASVSINGTIAGSINRGFLLLIGYEAEDNEDDIAWIVKKIKTIRLFSDTEGLMNLSIDEVKGEVLCISQFTLHAKTKKGTRPSFIHAAKPDIAIPLYNKTVKALEHELPNRVQTGEFGADMQVQLINDGPVTIIIDSKNKI